jgi:hypothetical protein
MSLNKVITLGVGVLLITAIFVGTIVIRPFWMKLRDPLNSSIYNINASQGITEWGRVRNTVDNNFWLIPIVGVFIILGWIYLSMSEKDYVGAGYYR